MASFNQSPLSQTSLALQAFSLTLGSDAISVPVVPLADKPPHAYMRPSGRRPSGLLR
jgi:hypothetical protein